MKFALNTIRFEDVRQQVIEFLKEKGEYTAQFDFKGSNLAYVIDSMAYTTMLLSYHLSTIANNVFLDTTEIRKNAVSIAKSLGYRPKRKKAARLVGRIEYHGSGFNSSSVITISPKLYFRGTTLGNMFVNVDKIQLTYESPLVLSGEFVLCQGEYKNFSNYGVGEPLQSFVLPTVNADEDNLRVFVFPTVNGDATTKDEWTEAKTFFEISRRDNKIFFVEEDIVNEMMPKIVFGNGIIGKVPTSTETIKVEYLETLGAGGNGEVSVSMPEASVLSEDGVVTHNIGPAFNVSNFKVVVPDGAPSFGGSDNETLSEIKVNAPKYFAAAGRGVTTQDFLTILMGYKTIDKVNIIGGDELYPGRIEYLGNAYITASPVLSDNFTSTAKMYLTESEEREIIEDLRKIGIIATKKHFIRPTYIYIDIFPSIEMLSSTSASDVVKIKNEVKTNLDTYIADHLADLGAMYRQSKIGATIDLTDGVVSSSITSNFYFTVNCEFFYKAKNNVMWLPVTTQKNEVGDVMYDDYGAALTKNFIKRNSTIVEQKNRQRDSNYRKMTYDIFSLPPHESSIYGQLTHPWLKRYLYNNDAVAETIIEVIFQSVNGVQVMTYNGFTFVDGNGKEYQVALSETGITNQWSLYFGSQKVGTMSLSSGAPYFTHTGEETEWLTNHGIYMGGASPFTIVTETVAGDVKHTVSTVVASTMSQLKVSGKNELFRIRLIWTNKATPTATPEYEFSTISAMSVTDSSGTEMKFEIETTSPDPACTITFGGKQFGTLTRVPGLTFVADIDASRTFDTRPTTAADGDTYRIAVAGNFGQGIDSTWYEVDEYIKWNGTAWEKVNPFVFTSVPYSTADEPGTAAILNDLGMNSDMYFAGLTAYAVDFYDEAHIGTFNYLTGETKFDQMVYGRKSSTESVSATIRDFFDNYGMNTKFVDLIRILPDDYHMSSGVMMGTMVDFDTRFNQKIVMNVNPIVVKQV